MRTQMIPLGAALALAASAGLRAQEEEARPELQHRSVAETMPARQVHLDFHTSEHIPGVGARFEKAQFQAALRKARLTAINIFAKGHHGWSYYPSEVGAIHPGLTFDLLGAELEACHEIGVECPFYFTVGWSVRDAELHPEWVVRRRDGSFSASNWDFTAERGDPRPGFSWKLLCPSGGYHEQIMRQVEEICRRYDVDGFFFDVSWGEFGGFKHPDAMSYEAAAMIASGAACNFGDQMHPSGEMDEETYRLIGEAFAYVEQIEDYGPGGLPASRLGLWLGYDEASDRGVGNMLLELHEDFAIADAGNLDRFETVILPGAPSLDEGDARALDGYLARGGKLLALGKGPLKPDGSGFAADLGVRYLGPPRYANDYTVAGEALGEGLVSSPFLNFEAALRVEPGPGTEVLAAIREPYFDRTYATYSSHQNTPFRLEDAPHPAVTRKGGVVYVAHALGRQYFEHGLRLHRQLFHNALRLVYERPMLEVVLPSAARVNLLHQPRERRYVVHLLYASPITRGRVTVIEDLPTLRDVPVAVRLPEEVRRVRLVPGGEELVPERREGALSVVVPELTMHRAVVFEY